MAASEEYHSVVIVGAGIAGLAAAKKLLPTFPDLVLLEASNRIGGRIEQVSGVLPWPVELGPEFIHGANTSLQEVIEEAGFQTKEHSWPDHWFFASEQRLKPAAEPVRHFSNAATQLPFPSVYSTVLIGGTLSGLANAFVFSSHHFPPHSDRLQCKMLDAEVTAVIDIFEGIGQQAEPAQDLSVEQWMRDGGASDKMIDIADACFANDFGCSLSQLGLRETILENQRWDSGETYLILDHSLSQLVNHLGQQLKSRICLNWPVLSVDCSGERIVLKASEGRAIQCQRLVLTVPITVLQRGDIQFQPALPQAKREALSRIKMSNAVKVIVAFERPIWPDGFFDVVCPGGFIPEFWVTRYPAEGPKSSQDMFGIVGFACGKKAEEISQMRPSAVIRATLAQLDEIFGSGAALGNSRYPATAAFLNAHIADWSKRPYIGGAYSYPSLGAEAGDRTALSCPVGDKIFFAGEATHPAVNPCLQAAYDTGLRAAAEILQASKGMSKL